MYYADTEKQDKQKGLAISIAVHLLLLLLFWFFMVYRAPIPPIPQYGIDFEPSGAQGGSSSSSSAVPVPETTEEEVITEETSDITLPTEKKTVETQKTTETKKTETTQTLNQNAMMNSNSNANSNNNSTSNSNGKNNAGTGNGGGGGGGTSLAMDGWVWATKPTPNDPTDAKGTIKFKFFCDASGRITEVQAYEYNVPMSVIKYYEAALLKARVAPQNDGTEVDDVNVGYVTFVVNNGL